MSTGPAQVSREEAMDQLDRLDDKLFDLAEYVYNKQDERIEELETENKELRDTLDAIQKRLSLLEDDGSSNGKESKVRDIVLQAKNLNGSDTGRVCLSARDIVGATGVSRRYAYDLIDRLPSEYAFLMDRSKVSQYGDLEIDKDAQERGLIVDFEQLHADPVAVNKFTNGSTDKGGEN